MAKLSLGPSSLALFERSSSYLHWVKLCGRRCINLKHQTHISAQWTNIANRNLALDRCQPMSKFGNSQSGRRSLASPTFSSTVPLSLPRHCNRKPTAIPHQQLPMKMDISQSASEINGGARDCVTRFLSGVGNSLHVEWKMDLLGPRTIKHQSPNQGPQI